MNTLSDNLYAKSKKAVLVVSYGSSNINSIDKTIGAIETTISNMFPNYELRRAFTSQIVIDTIRKKYLKEIENVEQALKMLIDDGIEVLVIQPTHILCGHDYDRIICLIEKYKNKFRYIYLGMPLLTYDNDYIMLVNALVDETIEYSNSDTAIIFIGHGTNGESNSVYLRLQKTFTEKGMKNYFVGTLISTSEEVIVSVKAGKYKQVILCSLMVTAGIHVFRDIAGEKNSLKSLFETEGFEVYCILKGIGEIKAVQNIYAIHAREAISILRN